MDTIAVGGGSGTYVLRYTEGELVRAADTSNTTSGANGVFITSTFAVMTARAAAMDSLISTANAVATFKDATSLTSVQGCSSDMVIKVARMLTWQAPTH